MTASASSSMEASTALEPPRRYDKQNARTHLVSLGIILQQEHDYIWAMQLKARYGGTRILTITTSPEHEEEVEKLVGQISPGYTRIYSVSGTQKFALPRKEVGLGQVFGAVEMARCAFPVLGWGVADTTLEEVFIQVAKEARAFHVLS